MAIAAEFAEVAPAAVLEQFRHYALTIRGVSAEKVGSRVVYLGRLFGFLGPPSTAAGLFASLTPKTITAFLIDYALRYGPGSRRDMHAAARAFLHFAYAEQFLPRETSRRWCRRCGTVRPRGFPEPCRSRALWRLRRASNAAARMVAVTWPWCAY